MLEIVGLKYEMHETTSEHYFDDLF